MPQYCPAGTKSYAHPPSSRCLRGVRWVADPGVGRSSGPAEPLGPRALGGGVRLGASVHSSAQGGGPGVAMGHWGSLGSARLGRRGRGVAGCHPWPRAGAHGGGLAGPGRKEACPLRSTGGSSAFRHAARAFLGGRQPSGVGGLRGEGAQTLMGQAAAVPVLRPPGPSPPPSVC